MSDDSLTPEDDLFYRGLIDSHVKAPHFIPRRWLAEKIKAAIADPDCRFLLLTAEPGAGKTTLLAWLARRHPRWPRYFLRHDGGNAQSLLFSVGYQLAALYPDSFHPQNLQITVEQETGRIKAGGRVTGIRVKDLHASPFYRAALKVSQKARDVEGVMEAVSVERLVPEERLIDLNVLQHLALLGPARALWAKSPRRQIVILVDALDELAHVPCESNILDWLTNCPNLPPNVRFVLTSRPDEPLLSHLRRRRRKELKEEMIATKDAGVRDDLRRYAEKFTGDKRIRKVLAAKKVNRREFVDRAVGKAGVNFQYLDALFRGIQSADADGEALGSLLELKVLPAGLEELYAFFLDPMRLGLERELVEVDAHAGSPFARRSHLPAWEGLYLPVLGVLSVARAALTAGQIRSLGDIRADESWVVRALRRLRQFLRQEGERYSLYHNTLPEFLNSPRTRVAYPDCYSDPAKWNGRVAEHYRGGAASWEEVDWRAADDYGLTHLIHHLADLVAAGGCPHAEFYRLICRPYMREKRRRYGSHLSFARDLGAVINVARSERPRNIAQEVRAQHLNALLLSFGTNVPAGFVTALARLGEFGRALSYVALMQGKERWAAVFGVARILLSEGRPAEALSLIFSVSEEAAETPKEVVVGFVGEVEGLLKEITLYALPTVGLKRLLRLHHNILGDYNPTHSLPSPREHVLCEVVEDLAAAGESERALEVVKQLGRDSAFGSPAVAALIEGLIRAGDLETAARCVTEETCLYERVALLSKICRALGACGRHERAGELAEAAAAVAAEIQAPSKKAWAYRELPSAFIAARRFENAWAMFEDLRRETAESGDRKLYADQALDGMCVGFLEAGEVGQAQRAFNELNSDIYKKFVAAALVRGLTERGRAEEAVGFVTCFDDEKTRSELKAVLAEALSNAGHFTEARWVASAINEERDKAKATRAVCRGMAKAGLFSDARQLARSFGDESVSEETETQIASEAAGRGELRTALAAVRSLRSPYARSESLMRMLGRVGKDAGRARKRAVALLLQSLEEDEYSHHHIEPAVRALTSCGEHEAARLAAINALDRLTADAYTDFTRHSVSRVLSLLIEAGGAEEARAALERELERAEVIERWDTDEFLLSLAAALARAGNVELAPRAASEIAAGGMRSRGVGVIVAGLTSAGRFGPALEFIRDIADEASRASALNDYLDELLRRRGREALLVHAEQIQMVEASLSGEHRMTVWPQLARLHALCGDTRGAGALIERIANPFAASRARGALAAALAAEGEFDGALGEVKKIVDVEEQASSLARVLSLLRRHGSEDAFAPVRVEARQILNRLTDQELDLSSPRHVAAAFVYLDDVDRVQALASEAPEAYTRNEVWRGAFGALIGDGRAGEASALAKGRIERGDDLAPITLILSESLLRAGHDAAAREAVLYAVQRAEGAADFRERVSLLRRLAPLLARVGELDHAWRATGGVIIEKFGSFSYENDSRRVEKQIALKQVIVEAGKRGSLNDVVNMLNYLEDDFYVDQTLVEVASALVGCGKNDEALSAAEMIESTASYLTALGKVAAEHSRRGKDATALAVLLDACNVAAHEGVDVFMKVVEGGADIFARPDGGLTLWEVYQDIKAVRSWWEVKANPADEQPGYDHVSG